MQQDGSLQLLNLFADCEVRCLRNGMKNLKLRLAILTYILGKRSGHMLRRALYGCGDTLPYYMSGKESPCQHYL